MPCEPVPPGVVPNTRPPSIPTSSLAFRMKRLGSGGGARRALTNLGTNDTQLNLRLAKSLLTISQEKFAKKWDFDPVREVPLPQGRFYWTPTTPYCTPCTTGKAGDCGGSSCRLLGSTVTCGSGGFIQSHDLGGAEAEDNAAAMRTCLNLPKTSDTITAPGHPELRVPPLHPEGPSGHQEGPSLHTAGPSRHQEGPSLHTEGPSSPHTHNITTAVTKPNTTPGSSSSGPVVAGVGNTSRSLPTATLVGKESPIEAVSEASRSLPTTLVDKERPAESVGEASRSLSTTLVDKERPAEFVGDANIGLPTTLVDKERPAESVGDANRGLPTTLVDKERVVDGIVQDNQCQYIDPLPTSGSGPTDVERRHQTPSSLTQACITNYLRPRKRSSAHLQEAVHSSKAKKVLLAA